MRLSRWAAGIAGTLTTGAALLAGCAQETQAPAPCDNSGTHLLAFSSDRGQAAGRYQIYLYDLDSQGFRLLRNLAGAARADSSPALSSDRQLIAFVRSDTTAGSPTRILLYDRGGCGFISRPALQTGHEGNPAFTGDALKLAFDRDTLGHRRLRMMNSTGNMLRLGSLDPPRGWDDWDPAPDQTGALIAFVSNRVTIAHPDGTPHVYVWAAAGDSLLALPGLDAPGTDLEPSLTADGRWLCFASDRAGGSGGFDLYVYDLAGRTLVACANLNSPEDDRSPSIRPDGQLIAFSSTRAGGSGKSDLWLYSRVLAAAPTQGAELGSAGDDIHPSVRWP